MHNAPIILASQSPRRKQLLEMLGLRFEIMAADIDETPPPFLPLAEVAEHLAIAKAKTIAEIHPHSIIVAADTIVLLQDEIIGKPDSEEQAIAMLHKLSGNRHSVISGVAVKKDELLHSFSDTTEVYFNPLSTEQIEHYVRTYKPLDKAGAYAIQEYIGLIGIAKIVGDYYNVMGLPVNRLVPILNSLGVLV